MELEDRDLNLRAIAVSSSCMNKSINLFEPQFSHLELEFTYMTPQSKYRDYLCEEALET